MEDLSGWTGIWPGGQAGWETWLWNVLGKQDAFSSRPDKPTGLCVARKGSGYLLPVPVSFGLSTPAAKCPKRVRLDKGGKVRGWRWQDSRDQSLRDVPEPLLLHFLSRGWESQSDPPVPLHSLPSLVIVAETLNFPGCLGPLISRWNRINSWNLDAEWIRGFPILKEIYFLVLLFVFFFLTQKVIQRIWEKEENTCHPTSPKWWSPLWCGWFLKWGRCLSYFAFLT